MATKPKKAPAKKQQAAKPKKVPIFSWKGVDKKGNKLKGEIEAPNAAEAKKMLQKQGIDAKSVSKQTGPELYVYL